MITSAHPTRSVSDRTRQAGRSAADRVVGALDRLIPLARRVGQAVRVFTIAVGVAAATIVGVAAWVGLPSSGLGWVLFAVGAALVAAPAVVLWMFSTVLADVLELPAKVRAAPGITKVSAGELSDLMVQARAGSSDERPAALPMDLWRVARLLLRSRSDLLGYGVIFKLISVPFLIAVGIAFIAGLTELYMAPALVIIAALLAVIA